MEVKFLLLCAALVASVVRANVGCCTAGPRSAAYLLEGCSALEPSDQPRGCNGEYCCPSGHGLCQCPYTEGHDQYPPHALGSPALICSFCPEAPLREPYQVMPLDGSDDDLSPGELGIPEDNPFAALEDDLPGVDPESQVDPSLADSEIQCGQTVSGFIKSSEVSHFSLSLSADSLVQASLCSELTDFDTVLEIRQVSGLAVHSDDDGCEGRASLLKDLQLPAGEWDVAISPYGSALPNGREPGRFELSISCETVEPELSVAAPSPDSGDELSGDRDECATGNGGCDHNCHNSVGTYYCSCDSGWELDGDGHTCNDVAEPSPTQSPDCTTDGVCEDDTHCCGDTKCMNGRCGAGVGCCVVGPKSETALLEPCPVLEPNGASKGCDGEFCCPVHHGLCQCPEHNQYNRLAKGLACEWCVPPDVGCCLGGPRSETNLLTGCKVLEPDCGGKRNDIDQCGVGGLCQCPDTPGHDRYSEYAPGLACDFCTGPRRVKPSPRSYTYGGGGGSPFDHVRYATENVTGISVCWAERVDDISVFYGGHQVDWTGEDGEYGNADTECGWFYLECHEHIRHVWIRSGAEIDGIQFGTDTGRTSDWFGGSGGSYHTLDLGAPLRYVSGRMGYVPDDFSTRVFALTFHT